MAASKQISFPHINQVTGAVVNAAMKVPRYSAPDCWRVRIRLVWRTNCECEDCRS